VIQNAPPMRDVIADYFDRQAGTREYWGTTHDDPASLGSASALRTAATYVRGLSPDDLRFHRLALAFGREGMTNSELLDSWLSDPEQRSAGLNLGDRTDVAAKTLRYGYRAAPSPPDDFLTWFAAAVEEGRPTWAHNARKEAGEYDSDNEDGAG